MNKKYFASLFSGITIILLALLVGRIANAGTTDPGTMADTTLPVAMMTAPLNNSKVSGTITVSANATDNVAVVGVQFILDGIKLGTEITTRPYSIYWNTVSATNNIHILSAVARDAAGNTSKMTCPDSCPVYVNVFNSQPDPTVPPVDNNPPVGGTGLPLQYDSNGNVINSTYTVSNMCVSCKGADGKDGVQIGNSCNTSYQCYIPISNTGDDGQLKGHPLANLTNNLSLGTSLSAQVTTLQLVLNAECFLDIQYATGIFGPRTLAAVKGFQIAYGIPATGYVGVITRTKINELMALYSADVQGQLKGGRGLINYGGGPLSIGSSMTNDVIALQTFLSQEGYMSAQNITGNFGPITQAAVKAFQGSNGLPSTGYVGALTIAKINGSSISFSAYADMCNRSNPNFKGRPLAN
jgi:hypothetical protein